MEYPTWSLTFEIQLIQILDTDGIGNDNNDKRIN